MVLATRSPSSWILISIIQVSQVLNLKWLLPVLAHDQESQDSHTQGCPPEDNRRHLFFEQLPIFVNDRLIKAAPANPDANDDPDEVMTRNVANALASEPSSPQAYSMNLTPLWFALASSCNVVSPAQASEASSSASPTELPPIKASVPMLTYVMMSSICIYVFIY